MLSLDVLLTMVGVLLVVIGVMVFLFGKKRPDKGEDNRHIFEAFGIKLDVANPSILLIMFGVVLMLTPRFVPIDLKAGSNKNVEPVVVLEEDGTRQAALRQQQFREDESILTELKRAEQTTAAREQALRQEAAAIQAEQERARRERHQAELAEERERAAQRPAQVEMVRHDDSQQASPKVAEQMQSEPLRLVVITGASQSVEGVDAVIYRDKMKRALNHVARELAAGETVFSQANPTLKQELRFRSMPEFCKRWKVDRVLYAEVEPPPFAYGIESANWPEASFAISDCRGAEMRESKPRGLSPTRGDSFPFQQALERAARDFFEANRGLLRS